MIITLNYENNTSYFNAHPYVNIYYITHKGVV